MLNNSTAELIARLVEQARLSDSLGRIAILERVDKLISIYEKERL